MAATMIDPATLALLLARSAALHAHLCPRQVLGVRLGLHGAALLGLPAPQADKRILTLVETDGCFADGVAAATGCWFGRRTLRLVDEGKVAATLVDTADGRAVRVWPAPGCRAAAAAYAPEAAGRWAAQLVGYQRMPSAELIAHQWVALRLDIAALVGRPGARAACAACGEEILNGRERQVGGATLCQSCAGEGYYD